MIDCAKLGIKLKKQQKGKRPEYLQRYINNLVKNLVDPSDLVISSREIADLVESMHDSVKRTIGRLSKQRIIGNPPMVEYKDSLGRTATKNQIGKRDSFVIVAQLSPEFTARAVGRWQELENQVSNPIASLARIDLLKLALDSEEKRIALEHKSMNFHQKQRHLIV